MIRIGVAMILTTMILISPSFAGRPLEDIRGPVEKGIALLKDPVYSGGEKKEEQRERIWDLVQRVFDFEQISMRTIAQSWRDFNPDQRKNFTAVFTELLKTTYMDKIQGEFHNEEVVFLEEDIIAENKAEVKSKIVRGGKLEIPIDYSMHQVDGTWRVYDVKIEGVSMVKNYRSQFKTILSKENPDALIQRIKDLNDTHEKERNTLK